MSPSIVGVNFGSSYASISVISKEGHADCIANEEGERQIACAISYNGDQIYIGNGATGQLVKNAQNTITGFRNLLGHKFDDLAGVPPSLTPSAPVISTADAVPGYKVETLVAPPAPSAGKKSGKNTPAASGLQTPAEPVAKDLVLTVPEVTTLFLKTLHQSATDFLGAPPSDGCVIAAPSSFKAPQREALRAAAEAAGFKVLQIIDESAAVLVGYRAGLPEARAERGLEPEGGEKIDKVVAVVDVGETGVEVEVVAVRNGEYVHLGGGRDETVGGRELNKVLISHFAKEFTKKTKVPLPLPVDPLAKETSAADLRAQTKLLLAIEHTKRSLSASSGAATCAVDALKDGLDLSASINRLRFDGLAGGVYRKIAAEVKRVVESCNLNVVEVDEVLLAGSSSLLPGLASAIEMTFPEGTPVSAVLDPSQAIAIGCALQALHLAELPTASTGALPLETLLATPTTDIASTARPIGLVIPGLEEANFHTVIPADTPLPARRLLALPVAKGVTTVGVEFWEGTSSIRTETVTPPPRSASELDSDEEDEDDEPEEVSTVVVDKTTFLQAVSIEAKDDRKVYFEVVADREGKVDVRAWLEGEEKA